MFRQKATFIVASGDAHTAIFAHRTQISSITRLGVLEGGKEQIEPLKSITIPTKYNKDFIKKLNNSEIKYYSLAELSGSLSDEKLEALLEQEALLPVVEVRDNRFFRKLAHIKVVVKC